MGLGYAASFEQFHPTDLLAYSQQAEAAGVKFADITLEFLQRNDVNKLTRTLGELDRIVQKK